MSRESVSNASRSWKFPSLPGTWKRQILFLRSSKLVGQLASGNAIDLTIKRTRSTRFKAPRPAPSTIPANGLLAFQQCPAAVVRPSTHGRCSRHTTSPPRILRNGKTRPLQRNPVEPSRHGNRTGIPCCRISDWITMRVCRDRNRWRMRRIPSAYMAPCLGTSRSFVPVPPSPFSQCVEHACPPFPSSLKPPLPAPGNCSLLRKKGIALDASPALAAPYLLSSRTFSPTAFLSTVHASSTANTLSSGLENLQESIQQESGALKQLVTGDFDRFVRCKNGIDEVYERMVEGGINDKEGYGTASIQKTLDGMVPLSLICSLYCVVCRLMASACCQYVAGERLVLFSISWKLIAESTAKAQELYNPVLDSRAKAERLRATLIILQRHKEYFNLPSLIASDIKKVPPPSRPCHPIRGFKPLPNSFAFILLFIAFTF